MAGTSVTLGPHWDEFIAPMRKDGRYASASDLMRAALRLLEEQEGQRARLRVALREGDASPDAGSLDLATLRAEPRRRVVSSGNAPPALA